MKLINDYALKLKLGRTYRAKMPTLLFSTASFNDRTIIWMSPDKNTLKYISADLKLGDISNAITAKQFLSWARMEVPMHPVMNRHYQMMVYRQIRWKEFGVQPPKNSKKLKSA